MKLRYYLRGLGVGILLATIILTIANRDNQPMTDAEVRARAAELGMVESGSVRLSEMTTGESAESAAETSMESTAETQESTAESSAESIAEVSSETAESTAETQESSAEPSSEAAESTAETQESSAETSSEATESTAEAQESSAEASSEVAETVTFEIRSGSGSDTVSRNLAAAGLVADASAFDDYLCDNGYSRRIRVGTYEIPVGSTDEEIARIITGG